MARHATDFPWLDAGCGACIGSASACAAVPVRVGLVFPLTGGSADFGNSARYGAELAVREINEAGGLMGRPFELVERDDRSDPEEGRKAAEDLVLKEKVNFTIGYCNTGVALKSIDVFQQAGHLLMVPCASGTAVTKKIPAAQSFIFRVAPTDAMMAEYLVREIVERRKIQQVAVLADSTGYGEGGLKDILGELTKQGLTPVHVVRFPLGVKSLTNELKQARAAGAQALISYTVGPEHAVAVRSRAELKWSTPYFAPWPLSFRSALEHAGPEALEGTMMVQSIVHDSSIERRAGFLARYAAHSKERPIGSLMAAAQSYDAVHLMLRALFVTKGATEGAALKAALENLERPYQGVVTTYERPFSASDHDAFSANMVWLAAWRKGEITFVDQKDAQHSSYIRRKVAQP